VWYFLLSILYLCFITYNTLYVSFHVRMVKLESHVFQATQLIVKSEIIFSFLLKINLNLIMMIETVNINLTIGLFDGHALHMVGELIYFR
jgi:hypothetical protein